MRRRSDNTCGWVTSRRDSHTVKVLGSAVVNWVGASDQQPGRRSRSGRLRDRCNPARQSLPRGTSVNWPEEQVPLLSNAKDQVDHLHVVVGATSPTGRVGDAKSERVEVVLVAQTLEVCNRGTDSQGIGRKCALLTFSLDRCIARKAAVCRCRGCPGVWPYLNNLIGWGTGIRRIISTRELNVGDISTPRVLRTPPFQIVWLAKLDSLRVPRPQGTRQ